MEVEVEVEVGECFEVKCCDVVDVEDERSFRGVVVLVVVVVVVWRWCARIASTGWTPVVVALVRRAPAHTAY